ncbi:MAG TPA: lytic murein transglycosylase [Pseudonocardiaceae bacterium]
MVRTAVAAMALAVLAAMMLSGCGGAAAPAQQRLANPDPVLATALAGEQPRAAADPHVLARQITVAEDAVRDPANPPERVAAGARTAQVAYLALVDRPDWDAAVLADVPAPLQETVRSIAAAERELRAMAPVPATTVPAWRIVEPPAASQLQEYYSQAQQRFGVPWSVLAAVHLVETRMGRVIGLSTAGAQGPMQFLPGTWARYGLGGDVWNTRDAILGAANYLAANGAARGTDAELDNALYRYNNDFRYVRAVRHLAALMQADERAFVGFHAWQVYYRTRLGDILLPVGYESVQTMPVEQWLARRPR